jgi:acetate kinase
MRIISTIDFLQQNVALFASFPPEDLTRLVGGSVVTTFEPNEAIIEFGKEGRFLGVLIEGEAEVSIVDDSGLRKRLNTLKTGEFFGEISLMTGDYTVVDIIAITACKALIIPQTLFSAMLLTHAPAIRLLSKSILDRLPRWTADQRTAKSGPNRSSDPYGLKLHSATGAKVLVINCGSSSLKYALFNTAHEGNAVTGSIENIGSTGMRHTFRQNGTAVTNDLPAGNHAAAFEAMVAALRDGPVPVIRSIDEITAIGHRVVHGGELFSGPVVVDDEVEQKIARLAALAPLHNPIHLVGIHESRRFFPKALQVAVFDTTFHQTLPPYAYLYGLPYEYYEKYRIRRYGFHGSSHLYVGLKAAEFLKRSFNALEIVSCHLGNGSSVCAIDHGRSIDTSMGLTPTDGLIMGTRCGSIDPNALLMVMQQENLSIDQAGDLLNKKSGLLGISGVSNDLRLIEKAARGGNARALLAIKSFCYNIRKYIGAYCAAMQGLDVVVFTGGIGENSADVRSLACQRLNYMGVVIDEARNQAVTIGPEGVVDISTEASAVRVLVVHTDEERMIARETLRVANQLPISTAISNREPMPVPVEVSAHHVHLAQADLEALFGVGHELVPDAPLSQPGQFAAKEQVTLVGPRGKIERVRVLGPVRSQTQIEIAMTEQFKLGIYPPIRESGDLENTPGITLVGAAGTVTTTRGVICARRHIHMAPEDALRFGVRDKDVVRVRVGGDRELIFGDVLVRINPNFRLAMHLDTDEANAANIKNGTTATIEGVQSGS